MRQRITFRELFYLRQQGGLRKQCLRTDRNYVLNRTQRRNRGQGGGTSSGGSSHPTTPGIGFTNPNYADGRTVPARIQMALENSAQSVRPLQGARSVRSESPQGRPFCCMESTGRYPDGSAGCSDWKSRLARTYLSSDSIRCSKKLAPEILAEYWRVGGHSRRVSSFSYCGR